tara:strand:+ start:22655 stop:24445 length:1791 start_codon:yes stop_codon:yes gene_type:complete
MAAPDTDFSGLDIDALLQDVYGEETRRVVRAEYSPPAMSVIGRLKVMSITNNGNDVVTAKQFMDMMKNIASYIVIPEARLPTDDMSGFVFITKMCVLSRLGKSWFKQYDRVVEEAQKLFRLIDDKPYTTNSVHINDVRDMLYNIGYDGKTVIAAIIKFVPDETAVFQLLDYLNPTTLPNITYATILKTFPGLEPHREMYPISLYNHVRFPRAVAPTSSDIENLVTVGYYVSRKYDGYRALACCMNDGQWFMLFRGGDILKMPTQWPIDPRDTEGFKQKTNLVWQEFTERQGDIVTVLDSELVAVNKDDEVLLPSNVPKAYKGNRGVWLSCLIIDVVMMDGEMRHEMPYVERLSDIPYEIHDLKSDYFTVGIYGISMLYTQPGIENLNAIVHVGDKLGWEGLVLRDMTGTTKDYQHTDNQTLYTQCMSLMKSMYKLRYVADHHMLLWGYTRSSSIKSGIESVSVAVRIDNKNYIHIGKVSSINKQQANDILKYTKESDGEVHYTMRYKSEMSEHGIPELDGYTVSVPEANKNTTLVTPIIVDVRVSCIDTVVNDENRLISINMENPVYQGVSESREVLDIHNIVEGRTVKVSYVIRG